MVHSAGDWWIETRTMPRERLAEYLTSLVYDGFPDLAGADGTRTWMPADTTAAAPTGPTAVAGDDRNPDRGITPLRTPRRRSS